MADPYEKMRRRREAREKRRQLAALIRENRALDLSYRGLTADLSESDEQMRRQVHWLTGQ